MSCCKGRGLFVFLSSRAYAVDGNENHLKGRRKLAYTGKSCIECKQDYPILPSIVNKGDKALIVYHLKKVEESTKATLLHSKLYSTCFSKRKNTKELY